MVLNASMGNEPRHHGLRIQRLYMSRLAQSHVTIRLSTQQSRHSTQEPTESHQALSSPCMILKVICTGVGWVWLARLVASVPN